MFKRIITAFAVLVVTTVSALSSGAEYGTREDAVTMISKAQEVFEAGGLQALVEQVNDAENTIFHDRDLYVFVIDMQGVTVAHGAKPKLVGKSLLGLRDQNGVEFVKEMIKIAGSTGEGWVDYQWPNPITNKVSQKSTLTMRLDDNHFAGVGIYLN